MSYIAIVLNPASVARVRDEAEWFQLLGKGWAEKMHHVTLAMGNVSGYAIGTKRNMTVTHYGMIAGRVSAFRVNGAGDSKNMFPHVTVAVAFGAKPVESNNITNWKEIAPGEQFDIDGVVTLC